MNAASGRCMGSTMQGYAITVKCADSDPTQRWEWAFSPVSSVTVMKHTASGYYLQCGCQGKNVKSRLFLMNLIVTANKD